MKSPVVRLAASAVLIVLLLFVLGWGVRFYSQTNRTEASADRNFQLSARLSTLQTVKLSTGEIRFRFEKDDREVLLTPEAFALEIRLNEERRARGGWFFRIFDITGSSGVFWVMIGLVGQLAFTGRMIVQWLVSEKHGRSIVPNAFWWMSLIGSSMLIAYFLWRVDAVGVLGQATGWFIYIRNLRMIYRQARPEEPGR